MRKLRAILFVGCLLAFGLGVGYADSLKEYFNLAPGLTPVASQGQVTFTLNNDGTIAGSVVDYNGLMGVFDYNAPIEFMQNSGFSVTPGWQTCASMDSFGVQGGCFGFIYQDPTTQNWNTEYLASSDTWTIGTPGEFSSVWQALGGNLTWGTTTGSSVDFVLQDNNGTWGAGSPAYIAPTATPEPGTLLLLGSGLVSLLGLARRKIGQRA